MNTCATKCINAAKNEYILVGLKMSNLQIGIFWFFFQNHLYKYMMQMNWEKIRKHLKYGLFEGRISNGPVFKCSGFSIGYSYGRNHSKTGPVAIWTFLSKFQMVFDKMAAICADFKWLGFPVFRSHSKSRPFATQPLLDHSKSRQGQFFRSPLYI